MVRLSRTAEFYRGKGVVRWAKEITDYINARFPQTTLQVFTVRYGPLNVICWMADFADVSALDSWQMAVGSDEGYNSLRKQSLDMLVEGSLVDTVMMSH